MFKVTIPISNPRPELTNLWLIIKNMLVKYP